MPSIRHKSKPARTPFVLLAMLFTFMAVIAVRPAAGLAEPLEPAEPEPPRLVFDPDHYDFGLTPVNSGASTGFQLLNTGTEAVRVDSVQVPGSEVFWTNTDCTSPARTLRPGESCFVQVYFNPHDTAGYAAQLRAYVGSYSFDADLTGTGGRAIFEPASNPTDFGVAKVGSAGVTREVEISNTGNMAGGVFIAVVSGGAVGSFQLLDEDCTGFMLQPDAACTAQIRFRPLSEGVKRATFSLFGEADGGTQIVLTGVGTAPDPVSAAAPDSPVSGTATAAADGAAHPKAGKWRPKGQPRAKRHRLAVHDARLVLAAHTEGDLR